MINLVKSQSVNAEESFPGNQTSHSPKTYAVAQRAGGFAEPKIIRLTQVESPDPAQRKAAERIEASLHYMIQHLNEPMKVARLSASVGLSAPTYYPLFKRATGQTPMEFFIRVRMHRASEYLEQTHLQVKEVAAMLGYDDQYYFSRQFKMVHGISPRGYRARRREFSQQDLKVNPSSTSTSTATLPHIYRNSFDPVTIN